MGLQNLKAGEEVPDDVNVVIEIASQSYPIKYEFDKKTEILMVDRFLETSMVYPCEYGFVPHTLSQDGDPIDVLVVAPFPLFPGCVIRCRPIGMLRMTDESGPDTKILAVPINKISLRYQLINHPRDVGIDFMNAIEHFFKHYKDLEPGKWTKIEGWEEAASAKNEIKQGIERYDIYYNNNAAASSTRS